MIDYLTVSVHYHNIEQYEEIRSMLMCVTMLLPPVQQKAKYPFNFCEDYFRYGTLMCRVRYSYKALCEGFVTVDLFGAYFSVEEWDKRIQRLIKCACLCCDDSSLKIARIDLRFDFEDFDTDYNPKGLHVNKMFDTGSGQPTYYYGNNESQIRVYDKKAEMFDTEALEVETPRLTRIEYQFRDRYLKLDDASDFVKICDDWLHCLLLRDFNIELNEVIKYGKMDFPKTYKSSCRFSFDVFKPYCTMAAYIILTYGEDAFLNYVFLNSKTNNKYAQFRSKELEKIAESLPTPQTYTEFLQEKVEYDKYINERSNKNVAYTQIKAKF